MTRRIRYLIWRKRSGQKIWRKTWNITYTDTRSRHDVGAPLLTFVDASGWIAMVNRRDALHQKATQLYQQRFRQGGQFVTSSVVLLEVGNWLSPVATHKMATELIDR